MKTLHVDRPCPMAFSRLGNDKGEFFCGSCSRQLIDYRGKSSGELRKCVVPGACGIFTIDQLPAQRKMKGWRRWAFSMFSVLSILGFAVKPLSAGPPEKPTHGQIVPVQADTSKRAVIQKQKSLLQPVNVPVNPKINTDTTKKVSPPKKYRVIGCPAF